MSLRDALQRVPRAYTITAAALAILLALAVVWYSIRPKPVPGLADEVLLKCVDPNCAQEFTTTMGWVNANWVSRDDVPLTPGCECPKCHKNTLAFARKCPHDNTIFFTNMRNKPGSDPGHPGPLVFIDKTQFCPKCGWDPREPLQTTKRP